GSEHPLVCQRQRSLGSDDQGTPALDWRRCRSAGNGCLAPTRTNSRAGGCSVLQVAQRDSGGAPPSSPAEHPIAAGVLSGDRAAAALSARRRGLYTAALLVPMIIILMVWCAFLPTDPDYWWHVRTGQLIFEQHGIATTDPFSFTAVGKVWVDDEWLTELMQ